MRLGLLEGNEAIARGGLAAGCRFYRLEQGMSLASMMKPGISSHSFWDCCSKKSGNVEPKVFFSNTGWYEQIARNLGGRTYSQIPHQLRYIFKANPPPHNNQSFPENWLL